MERDYMSAESHTDDGLLEAAKRGEAEALAQLINLHRDRLRRMVEIRLDDRLAGRIDPSDVLQEAFLDVQKRIHELRDTALPFFLWLRLKVGNRLIDLHRFHLGARRSVRREVSLQRGAMPMASSASLASQLFGKVTSASNAAMRAEARLRVQEVLNGMDDIDREVLVLRHFEDLSNVETAAVLNISQNAASNRYVRALRRLKEALAAVPGFSEHSQ
jgi:RNA polymerase sigma-70 factor (ECF subfamily)